MSSLRGLSCAVAVAFAVASAPGAALAEPTAQELAAARQTFVEGKELEKNGDWTGALEKFKRVADVKVTPQVRFHIALCEENLGKLVSALKGFELAGEEGRQAGSSAVEVAENAPVRAEALKKRIAYVTIEVQGKLVTSKISLDGIAIGADKVGVPQMVDPGRHSVKLESKGETKFDKELTVAEKGRLRVVVPVDDTEDAAAPPAGASSSSAAPPPPAGPSRVPAYIVGGVGIAALGAGGVLMGLSQLAASDVAGSCDVNYENCDPDLQSTGDRGKLFYTASFIVGGAGAGLLVTGVVLFFVLGPKQSGSPKAGWQVPTPGRPAVEYRF